MDIRFGELHPLENTLVLKNIFECCSLADLKNCRLVSKLWRDTSRSTWRSSAVAKIHTEPRRRGGAHRRGESYDAFYQFTKIYAKDYDENGLPFTSFHLTSDEPDWFYDTWGPCVQFLKLSHLEFDSVNDFLNIIFNYCPNIEEIVLYSVTVHHKKNCHDGIWKSDQIDWEAIEDNKKLKSLKLICCKFEDFVWLQFFSRLPSLQDLTLRNSNFNWTSLFHSIIAIREQHPSKLCLKKIHLKYIEGSPLILKILLDPLLDLESLKLTHLTLRDLSNSIPSILSNNASSLKELAISEILDDNILNDFSFLRQKKLENLQKLDITWQNEDYPLANFLKLAPNLRKLIFRSFSARDFGINFASGMQNDIKLNYCTELELCYLSVEVIEHLVIWMPNLKRLKITAYINNRFFSMICEHWSNLVRLDIEHLNWMAVNDLGLTGLDDEDVEKINENWNIEVWRPTTVPRANITGLKNLQKFSISAARDERMSKPNLGYCAVAYGIEQMPNLKHLSISGYKLQQGGPETFWKNLSEKYPMPEHEDSDWHLE